MPYYVCHSGTVKLDRTGEDEFYTAADVASLYGLAFGEYIVGGDMENSPMSYDYVHLYPRSDEAYRDIKTEVGDTPDGIHYDKPAFWDQKKRNRENRLER